MANDFSAGKVYVQVLPSLDGWRKDVQRQMNTALAGVVGKVAVDLELDKATLAAEAAKMRREVDRAMKGLTVDLTLNLKAGKAIADLTSVRQKMTSLRDKTIRVDANTARALAKLQQVQNAVQGIGRGSATVNVSDGGSIDAVNTRMKRLIALAIAGSGAIGGLGAALIALGAGAVVGGAGLLSVAAGATAITGAMKAQTAASRQAGQTVAQEASQRLTAANQVLNAQDAIVSATRNVASAQRAASEGVRTALLSQARAEEQLKDAQVEALRAQEALTQSKRDAKRSIEDLANQVISDSLAQRDAVFALEDAQKALNDTLADPGSSQRQRDEARLTFDQATQRLNEINLAYQRSQVDAAEAAAAGVDGSRQVIAAQDQLVDAQRAVTDAQTSAAEAARRIERERIEGAEQVLDAQMQVVHAQRQLAQAMSATTVQNARQGEAQEKFAEALDKLTPQSLNLIRYLRSQSGEWWLLTQAAQGFAPGLESALQTLQPHFGDLNENVEILSTSFGSMLEVLADGLVDAKPFFDQIAGASKYLFPRFGETVNNVAHDVGVLALDMLPLVDNTLDVVDAAGDLVESWSPFIAQASGPLLDSLGNIIDNLDFLGPLLVAVAEPAGDLTDTLVSGLRGAFLNLMPALEPFLQSAVDLVHTLSPLLEAAGTLSGALANAFAPALRLAGGVLTPFVGAIQVLANLVAALPTELTGLIASLYLLDKAVGPLQRGFGTLGTNVAKASTEMSTFAQKAGVPTSAAGRFATAGGRIGDALTKAGNALPFFGLALVGIGQIFAQNEEKARRHNERLEQFATAINRGGEAARMARTEISQLGFLMKISAEQAEEAARKQAAGMTDVELAQGRVNQARLEYDRSVRDHGEVYAQWKGYKDRYETALGELKVAEQEAADSAKSLTEQLEDQQNQLLAMTDANIAHQRSGVQLTKAQQRLKQLRDGSIPNATPQDVIEAELDLASAQSHYVATATAAAEATAKANGVQDVAAARARGTNTALVELIRTQGSALPPSLLSMAAGMSDAEKAFFGLTARVDETGQTILELPGTDGKPIAITFTDNIDHVTARTVEMVAFLQMTAAYLREHLGKPIQEASVFDPKRFLPTTRLEAAPGLQRLKDGLNRATGGYVPGRGNTDSVHAMLTPGEFVFSKPAVSRLGLGNLHGLHQAARYAAGGLVTPQRFATGGLVGSAGGFGISANTGALVELIRIFGALNVATGPFAASLDGVVVPALQDTLVTSDALATQSQADWAAITATVSASSAMITGGPLATLMLSLAQVNKAITFTATVWAQQWASIQEYAAIPVRWTLAHPFNEGLISAWNSIDSAFGLGKQLAPLVIPFAVGGPVPGKGDKDSVRAYLTPGEYVLSKPAIRNLGGLPAVDRLHALARSGVIGPHQRLGGPADGPARLRLMRTVPLDGLGFAYGGVQPHVAAAGAEIEAKFGRLPGGIGGVGSRPNASDHPFGLALDFMTMTDVALGNRIAGYLQANAQRMAVKYLIWQQRFNDGGGWSAMADRGNPTANHMDHVHSSFLNFGAPGSPFSGLGGFDPEGTVAPYFADTYRMIGQFTTLFASNLMAQQSGAIAGQAADAAKAAAVAAIMGPLAGLGGGGTGPVAEQVRAVAARYGWGEGFQWDALSTLISHESGWNPLAQNPTSTAFGAFQFLDSTWRTVGATKTANPTLQAEAGMRYIQQRYKDPAGAWAFWNANHWYDDGGYLPPGLSLAYNGTSHPEPVLTPDQWGAMTSGGAGGSFTGNLYLDSGEFLGKVDGRIEAANNATGSAISRRTRV
ncbi:MAG TPA: transglycosylase SLT domain-containing protein [Pedococcus sp.]|nr:transglycosylase SLT domain-containing protein [Pedococcus sp.]